MVKGGKARDIPVPTVMMKFLQTYVRRLRCTSQIGSRQYELAKRAPEVEEHDGTWAGAAHRNIPRKIQKRGPPSDRALRAACRS